VTARHLMSVSYQSLTVPVPRCRGCVARHSRSDTIHLVGAIVGVVAGLAIALSIDGKSHGRRSNPCVSVVGGAIVGGIAGFLLALFMTRAGGLGDEGSERDFPPIQRLLAEGWKFGTKPGKGD
jgi:ammonia channel protein AmtB